MGNLGGESLEYWLQWQVPVCALIIILPPVITLIFLYRVKTEPLNAIDLWIPCWKNLNPIWLLIYRAFVFVFMSWLLYQMIASDGAFGFYFYTQWTFTLVILYFALGTIISAHGCWMYSTKTLTEHEEKNRLLKRDSEESKSATTKIFNANKTREAIILQSDHEQEVTGQSAGFWGCLMQAVYQTSAGAAVLTDIVFWCILIPFMSSEHFELNLLMGCMHSLNAVFLLLDTALNNLPFPWFRLAYFVLWSSIYVIFQWVLHACGFTWWPYPFLELSTPWAPLWYFSLAVIHIPCYGLYAVIAKAKISIYSKLFLHAIRESY